ERTAQIAGFRYFNVYGPREQHKGRMASVALHFFEQYRAEGRVRLFEGSGGYGAGQQLRDFIAVEDAAKVKLYFLGHRDRSGIFNVGTGRATSFNDVAAAVINACRSAEGLPAATLEEHVRDGRIVYTPFPPQLIGRYQSFTEADVSKLRAAGYTDAFTPAVEGTKRFEKLKPELTVAPAAVRAASASAKPAAAAAATKGEIRAAEAHVRK